MFSNFGNDKEHLIMGDFQNPIMLCSLTHSDVLEESTLNPVLDGIDHEYELQNYLKANLTKYFL